MEWATQDEQLGAVTPSTQDTMAMAPAPAPAVPASPSLAANSEQCQSCGAYVAPDQRYCLHCGQRRGDPRLPFMDASSFMETSIQQRRPPAPPPASPKKSRMSPNASLIAGVGTLLLAMGVGVLIGHSGGSSGGTASTPAVQVVKVPGTGAAAGAADAAASTGKKGSTDSSQVKVTGKDPNANAAAAVLKPSKKAGKLPPATVKMGAPGSGRGYKNGKFTGDFFGQ